MSGKNIRVDVALPTYRGRVAELVGHRFDGRQHLLTSFTDACMALPAQHFQRLKSREPRAKVFCREWAAARLAQVVVHVAGADGTTLAFLVYPLKQLLAGNVAAVAHDAHHRTIGHQRPLRDAALAPKLQRQRTAFRSHMAVSQCSETE